eukprot:scaffold90086_cov21-Tisochrysis_lutea.AAC.1
MRGPSPRSEVCSMRRAPRKKRSCQILGTSWAPTAPLASGTCEVHTLTHACARAGRQRVADSSTTHCMHKSISIGGAFAAIGAPAIA